MSSPTPIGCVVSTSVCWTDSRVDSHGMASFADALRALNALKADGIVEDYAIAGAMAVLFWGEPVPGAPG